MLLECVPNVSEGRRAAVIDRLAKAAESPATALLDVSSDPDHHRTVLTLAGEPDALLGAVVALYAEALALIDLRQHDGVHPRLGVVDVVPFVPLAGASMQDAIDTAHRLGALVARRFGLPVFLYEAAARRPDRRDLADVRRGGYAGVERRLATPAGRPDLGPRRITPAAGATAIGARAVLIAFNVVLASADLAVARAIARAVRERDGGLLAVKAIGVPLRGRGRVQVSMNLVDYQTTPPQAAFDRVVEEAARRGIAVVGSEIVGLVPRSALPGDLARLRLERFTPEMVLENRLAAARAPRSDAAADPRSCPKTS